MPWREFLDPYSKGNDALFDAAFVDRWAEKEWSPTDDDKRASAKLHVQMISRIATQRLGYPGKQYGYLLYVKLSFTGNEGEFLRCYRLDEPAFPHLSTADLFFNEAQFEAYRSLGEHIGEKLFLRALVGAEMASSNSIGVEDLFRKLGTRLLEPLPAQDR